jgi:hypothetical protein
VLGSLRRSVLEIALEFRAALDLFDRRSAKALHLTAAQLALLIEGIDWRRTVAPEAPKRPVSCRFRAFLDTLTRTLEMEQPVRGPSLLSARGRQITLV